MPKGHLPQPARFLIRWTIAFAGVLTIGWLPGTAWAWQDQPSALPAQPGDGAHNAGPDDISLETLQARFKEVSELTTLDPAIRTAITDALRGAIDYVKTAEAWATRIATLEKAASDASEMVRLIREELAQPPSPARIDAASLSLQQHEQKLAEVEASLATAQQMASQIDTDLAAINDRRVQSPKDLASARQAFEQVQADLAGAAQTTDPIDPAMAQRLRLLARQATIQREIASLELEARTFEPRVNLLTAQRDRAARRVSEARELVAAWQGAVDQKRTEEAREAAEQAAIKRQEAARGDPAVKEIAAFGATLSDERGELLPKITEVTKRLDAAKRELELVNERFQNVRKRVEKAGASEIVGLLLRKQRQELPDVNAERRAIRSRQTEIALTQLALIEKDDQRRQFLDLDQRVNEVRAALPATSDSLAADDITAAARRLLEDQRTQVEQLRNEYSTYFDKLVELDATQRELIEVVDAYSDFIDERILWIRSGSLFLTRADLTKTSDALTWMMAPAHSIDAIETIRDDFQAYPWLYVATGFVIAMLFGASRWLLKALWEIADQVQQFSTDRFMLTIRALLITLGLALPWPVVMWLLAWRLVSAEDAGAFTQAVGYGLDRAARLFLALELLRQLCRSRGVGEVHFQWPAAALRLVRRNVLWLMIFGLPLTFIIWTLEAHGDESFKESLGRYAFIAAMFLVAVVVIRVFRPGGSLMQDRIARSRGGWLDRLQFIWFPALVAVPIGSATVAALGYYYSAFRLEQRQQSAILLLLGLMVLNAILLRWLFVVRRRLAIEQARKRRAAVRPDTASVIVMPGDSAPATASAIATGGAVRSGGSTADPPLQDAEVDLISINAQTRQLVRSAIVFTGMIGLWAIFADVLPALEAFNNVTLWSQVENVRETVVKPDAPAAVEMVERTVAVTLGDILLAIVFAAITTIAAKNIPGLLEITILQRLPIHPSSRYAISTLGRYIIVIVGVILAFNTVGIGWSKVQWIAAAVTFGLGFGLQEIFANFVSGIIILFERPVRVGDTVTIGAVTGTVSRIRMRATTVTDYDRKVLVIPNRDLITAPVVNWTLTDSVTRIIIPIGVAYGTDIPRAKELLLAAAWAHPKVLGNPPPRAIFLGFGESTLNIELRVFVQDLDDLLNVRDELCSAIDATLQKEKITIAFPQRDLYVRSLPEIVLRSEAVKAAAEADEQQ